jgi:dihydrofolate synthase/folylpolyglutamate synthase
MNESNINQLDLNAWLYLLENRHQDEIQLGLARIKTVANRLDLCRSNACVITIAGTNGKGSTVAVLDAIYNAAGFRVGRFTSPHLLRFNERICVNQVPITDEALCDAFRVIEHARQDVLLTYFEMTTLAALYYFKQYSLDVIILEVGMGGRLDATNIIDAIVAIITTVDLDHQNYLGSTIDAIGYEKAGILRANQPFIYADDNPPASVINKAYELETPLQCLGKQYSYYLKEDRFHVVLADGQCLSLPRPNINLKAAAAAVVVSDILNYRVPVTQEHLIEAMNTVRLSGRQQLVYSNAVTTLFDVAHNPQAVALLAEFLGNYPYTGIVHAVFSGLKDKDLAGLIKPMLEYVDVWYLTTLQSKRAANELMLMDALGTGVLAKFFCDPAKAYTEAMHKANPGDIIVVYGSFLIVSAVMLALNETKPEEL